MFYYRFLYSSIQEIQLDKQIKLLDSPGVIIAKGSMDDPALALRNCVMVSRALSMLDKYLLVHY